MKYPPIRAAVLAALSGMTAGLSETAWSQDGISGLEEVIVTATRRDTNVQDLPMAVTAITADALENQNIENAMDLTAVVPNVLIYGGGRGVANGQITMRGIPNVGTYVDGVWQVSQSGLLQRQFVELERVEVLRGPQGTLIGRDSTGGSIQLFTKPPEEEFGMSINIGVGEFDRRDASVSVDVPLAENFRSKWTIANYEKDGYVTSVVTGDKQGDSKNEVLRGDLLWEPTDRASVRLILAEDELTATTARVQTFINPEVAYDLGWQVGIAEAHDIASLAAGGAGFNCQSTVAGCPGGQLGKYENRMGFVPPDTQDLEQAILHVDYDIGDSVHVKYIYGNTEMTSSIFTDFAGAEFNFFTNYDVNLIELESHELQLTGGGDRYNWVAGVYAWDQENTNRGIEWSHSDWTHAADSGARQVLDFDDVLNSPACSMTPADRGRDFEGQVRSNGSIVGPADTLDGWVLPCSQAHPLVPFGLFVPAAVSPTGADITVFNSTNGLNGSDRSTLAAQDGIAYFGEFNYLITDKWDVTLGYRLHDQDNQNWDKDVALGKALGGTELRPVRLHTEFADLGRALNAPIDPASLTENSFDESTIRFATSYRFNDDVMAYISYSEGFNAGGIAIHFDSLGRVITQFQPENIENIELGLRADFLNGRLRANLTYFDTDWIDIQATRSVIDRATLQPITEVTTDNAAKGNAEGFEVELTYIATDSLLFSANLGWSDTKYFDILPGAQITENTEFGGSPDRTSNLALQYDWGLRDGGTLTARYQANYWGRFWRSAIPSFRQDIYGGNTQSGDFWTTSARLVYAPAGRNYELSLWGNNLNEAYNINSGFMDSIWQFDFAGVDAPREVGLSMKLMF